MVQFGQGADSVAPLTGAWIETPFNLAIAFRACVAPLTGAWIETNQVRAINIAQASSRPSRARGLKQIRVGVDNPCYSVAPLTGAWIETQDCAFLAGILSVAPLTGAWIETAPQGLRTLAFLRRAPHGRVD